MIDFENQIYTKVAQALRTAYGNDFHVQSITTYSPEVFPLVCVEEADNYADAESRDSGSNEVYANIMYEVTVYSNKASKAKSECKAIFQTVDTTLATLGFTRTVRTTIRMKDAQICRMVGRYEAQINSSGIIFRR